MSVHPASASFANTVLISAVDASKKTPTTLASISTAKGESGAEIWCNAIQLGQLANVFAIVYNVVQEAPWYLRKSAS